MDNEITDINSDDSLEFIWGIKSYDDLTGGEPSIYSMNDIDIVYDKDKKVYLLGIETIYCFQDKKYGPQRYIKDLLNKMTQWMDEKGYDKSFKPNIYHVFTQFMGCHYGYESIEEVYGCFKFLADKFCEGLHEEEGNQ